MKFSHILLLFALIFLIYKFYYNNNEYFFNTLFKNKIREKAKEIWNKDKNINKIIEYVKKLFFIYYRK